ncbi:MAG: hypothetical protein ACE5JS_21710 [Nitrospinota bacterium]
MPSAVFDKATLLLRAWQRWGTPDFDAATEVAVSVPGEVDRRTERWDGATGVRPATAQEIADYYAAELDAEATAEFEGRKALKALVIYLAGKFGLSAAQARDQILSIYRSL